MTERTPWERDGFAGRGARRERRYRSDAGDPEPADGRGGFDRSGRRITGDLPIVPAVEPSCATRTRARRLVESTAAPTEALPPLDDLPRRLLTSEERAALRDRRRATLPPLPDGPAPDRRSRRDPYRRRPSEPLHVADDYPEEDPTDETATGIRDRPSGRTVTLGALLFVGLLVVTIGAGGLLTGGDDAPDPTATAAPTVLALGAAGATPEPTRPATPTAPGAADGRSADALWPGEGDGRTVVCLDPGHGGWDLGYTRISAAGLPAMAEADYNLVHAYDLAAKLEERGFVVVMTRRTPNAVNADGRDVNGDGETIADSPRAAELDEHQARINVCNEAEADLLVSMHVNGFETRPWVAGYETWYTGSRPFGEQSHRFATLVYRALGEELAAAGYAVAGREVNNDDVVSVDASDPSLEDHMIITGPDVRGKIDASEMPGAIVESLFISNDADAAFLATPAGHDAIVAAYEAAIVEWFAEHPG